jgi:phage protein U
MLRQTLPAAGAALAALALAGCGVANPYAATATKTATGTTTRSTTTTVDRDPAPERGGTIPTTARSKQETLPASAAQLTPVAALTHYAQLYTNWTAKTVSAAQTELASISLGSARAQALQAAASYRQDTTLLRSQVANRGTVVAITNGRGVAAGEWVVVTREATTGRSDYQGLPAQLHVTYAQVTKTANGWVVSSWLPQT